MVALSSHSIVMRMNMIMKIGERETGPKTASNIIQPPSSRGNLTITTDTQDQARLILKSLEETMVWVRMTFKPKRSRSLIIHKGRTDQKFQLSARRDNPIHHPKPF